jgi:hypothetical protein
VSDVNGKKEFVRVVGNTTGSHLAGAKSNAYGTLERLTVEVKNISEIMQKADLLKVDAEGHEKEIVLSTSGDDWEGADMILEVNNADNAKAIWSHLKKHSVNVLSQKTGWSRVRDPAEIPHSYREGSLFLTRSPEMPWSP